MGVLREEQKLFTLEGRVPVRSRAGHLGSLKGATFAPSLSLVIAIPDDNRSNIGGAKTEDSLT
jgi:hypothetical protein